MLELTRLTDNRNMKRVSVSDVVREYLISLDNKHSEVQISSELGAGLPFVIGNPCPVYLNKKLKLPYITGVLFRRYDSGGFALCHEEKYS